MEALKDNIYTIEKIISFPDIEAFIEYYDNFIMKNYVFFSVNGNLKCLCAKINDLNKIAKQHSSIIDINCNFIKTYSFNYDKVYDSKEASISSDSIFNTSKNF